MGPAFVFVEVWSLTTAAHGFQHLLAKAPARALTQIQYAGEFLGGVVAFVRIDQENSVKRLDNRELTLLQQGLSSGRL